MEKLLETETIAYKICNDKTHNLIHFSFPENINKILLLGDDYRVIYEVDVLKVNNIVIRMTDADFNAIRYALMRELVLSQGGENDNVSRHMIAYNNHKIKKLKPLPSELYDEYIKKEYIYDIDYDEYEQDLKLLLDKKDIHQYNELKNNVTYVEHLENVKFLTKIKIIDNDFTKNSIEIDSKLKRLANRYKKLLSEDEIIEHEVTNFDMSDRYIKDTEYVIIKNKKIMQKFIRVSPRNYFLDYFVNSCQKLNILREDTTYNIPNEKNQVVSINNKTKIIKRYLIKFCSTFIDPLFGDKITLNDVSINNFKEVYCMNEVLLDEHEAYKLLKDIENYINNVIASYLLWLEGTDELNYEEKKFLFRKELDSLENKLLAQTGGNQKIKKIIQQFIKEL